MKTTWLGALTFAVLGWSCSCSSEAPDPRSPISAPVAPALVSPVAAVSAAARAAPKKPAAPRGASEGPTETASPAPLRFTGTELAQDTIIEGLARADAISFKPVGARAALFRTALAVPFEAAFKAPTAERPLGPQAEVAAYAVARCLRLDNVPPAVARAVPLEMLRARLASSAAAKWPEIAARVQAAPDGLVHGAFIYWIADLTTLDIDRAAGLTRAREQLRIDGILADADKPLATAISAMLAFDYIVGNFDRWSGGNVKGSPDRARLYVRDHDLAMPRRLSDPLHARLASEMQIAQRVGRSFYEHARALTSACIERELSHCRLPPGEVSAAQIAGVLDRRDGFVSHVQALIDEHGQDAVLFFP